jgi:hypothetical protein
VPTRSTEEPEALPGEFLESPARPGPAEIPPPCRSAPAPPRAHGEIPEDAAAPRTMPAPLDNAGALANDGRDTRTAFTGMAAGFPKRSASDSSRARR